MMINRKKAVTIGFIALGCPKNIVDSERMLAQIAKSNCFITTDPYKADAVVINAQGAADARVIQAQAESQALQLIAGALENNDTLLLYQYISKLAPGVQVMLVPNNNPYLLNLPALPTATPTPTTIP